MRLSFKFSIYAVLFFEVCNFLYEGVESGFVVDGKLGELFSVHLDIERFQTRHKYAVFKTRRAAGGIDADNPELSKFAAANFSVSV